MNKKTRLLNLSLLLGLLIAPIVFYIYQFGVGIWKEHDDWAAMGSAIGGLYSPIIALLAFVVLSVQVRSQLKSEAHNVDMLFIQGCKEDIEFGITRLESELGVQISDQSETVGDYLNRISDDYIDQRIDEAEAEKLFCDFNSLFPKVLPLWCSVNSTLLGLGNSQIFPYEHNFVASKLKINGVLAPKCCKSLDMLIFFTVGNSNNLLFWDKPT